MLTSLWAVSGVQVLSFVPACRISWRGINVASEHNSHSNTVRVWATVGHLHLFNILKTWQIIIKVINMGYMYSHDWGFQSASQPYWAASLAGDTLFTLTLSSHIQSQPHGITKSHLVNKLIKTSIRRLTFIFCSSSRSWVQLTRWKKTTAYWSVWTLFRLKSRLSVWTETIKASRTSRLRQHFEKSFWKTCVCQGSH